MTLLVFLLVLSFLVCIHELGHFVMARRAGVKVEEFGFGYPPKMWRFFKDKRGTEYTVNWLPFGGFVRLHGEDAEASQVTNGDTVAFYAKKKRVRLVIIVAGAVMNFIFGAVAFGILYSKSGIPEQLGYVLVEEVTADTPAAKAGLVRGDTIYGLMTDGVLAPIKTTIEFQTELAGRAGQTVTLSLGEGKTKDVYVRKTEERPEGQGALGVAITDFRLMQYPWWQMPVRGMWIGIKAAFGFGVFLLEALGKMLYDWVATGVAPKDVAGPVGIVHLAQKEGLLTSGWEMILNFAAILSINLGVVNLLLFPALDGGRAIFVLLEGIIKKEKLAKVERAANMVGMALLLLMIV